MGLGLILVILQLGLVAGALQFHGSADVKLRQNVAEKKKLFPMAMNNSACLSFKKQKKCRNSSSNQQMHVPSKMMKSNVLADYAVPPQSSRKRNAELFHGSPTEDTGSHIAAAPSIVFRKHHRDSGRIAGHPSESPVYPPRSYHARGSIFENAGPLASPFRHRRRRYRLAPAPSPTISYSSEPSLAPLASVAGNTRPARTEGCASTTCAEPLTYPPSGSHCGCVFPIQVKLQLGVELYTFFPLVSELEKEIASSVSLNHSQARIMGADSVSLQQLERTTVLINLVPQGAKFTYPAASEIYRKFWSNGILINESLFGDYKVLYVHYPGLPPSPPSAASSVSEGNDRPIAGGKGSGEAVKPLGVNVPKRKHRGLRRNMIAVVVLSSLMALFVCSTIAWMLVKKYRRRVNDPYLSSPSKPSVPTRSMLDKSFPSSASASLRSAETAYLGAAKVLNLTEIEKATNYFDASRILGEGGFGVVYSGTLEGGEEVAVKVLKRENQHGSREFLAEVEMLSRLHHRNLVKLTGICTDEKARCLVYELIPNGSVESHLHGRESDMCPLDWGARMKIALGAARGLAYLHEDSNPRVIHRDFKASNILLEHDFTPKLSDFGLARAAQDEGTKQISTHVMGTFGYLAPEYAMTGHLLVKSDVYSYGVVLLELLTGRKPVDLSQPPGQENLVAWARPLLTSKEGLETIVDQSIQSNDDTSVDSLAKVAAIASMCVQPEASHRPFMGEVVQALKLVCSEFDETRQTNLKSVEDKNIKDDPYDTDRDNRVGFSGLCGRDGVEDEEFWSVSRECRSEPLRMGKREKFWQRLKRLSKGSTSEHEFSLKFWPGSN